MGASSVTGVGQGSADKAGQKGSEHLWVGVEKLIGPRIVHAGSATLVSGTPSSVAVLFAVPLPGVVSDYIVLATTVSTTGTRTVSVGNFTVNGFTIYGTNSTTDVVQYAVVRVDQATAPSQVVPTGGNVAY